MAIYPEPQKATAESIRPGDVVLLPSGVVIEVYGTRRAVAVRDGVARTIAIYDGWYTPHGGTEQRHTDNARWTVQDRMYIIGDLRDVLAFDDPARTILLPIDL